MTVKTLASHVILHSQVDAGLLQDMVYEESGIALLL
jgi:hypothetical protein